MGCWRAVRGQAAVDVIDGWKSGRWGGRRLEETREVDLRTVLPRRLVSSGIAAILALSLVALAQAGIGGGEEIPTSLEIPVRALLSHEAVTPGDEYTLAVVYEVPADAHIQLNDFFYAQPAEGELFTLGEPLRPRGSVYEGETIYKGRTPVFYRIRFPSELEPGRASLRLLAGYQACIERPVFACFAPEDRELVLEVDVLPAGSSPRESRSPIFASMKTRPLSPGAGSGTATGTGGTETEVEEQETAPVEMEGASEEEAAAGPTAASEVEQASEGSLADAADTSLEGRLRHALATGSLLAFLLVFLGGIATSFTPCVYPMIPITISYIGGRSRSRLGGLFLAVFFVLGIALTYSVLGVVAASTGALFGSAMQSTPVLLVVSAVFFAMGASMLGAFDLALPAGLQTKLQGGGPRAGVLGALFMGMVTGLVASPCVGPVVVVLLTWVAQVGSIWYGFLLLFVFALGLGMLFLVIGTFAGALGALPEAGGWMDTVKHIFGVILIAMGIYYIRSLLGPDWTWIVSGAFVLMIGTNFGAFRPIAEDTTKGVLFRKGFGILLVLAGGFVFLVGLARYSGVPLGGFGGTTGEVAAAHEGLNWIPDDVTGLAQAQTEGRPAVIDFYADWCAACKELDEKTWIDPAVRREGERFVAIKLDLTERNEWSRKKQDSYGVPGLPTVIFFDSSGQEVERFFGFRPPEEVLVSMRRIR